MNAATRVFNIPELMELILLALPFDTSHTELSSMRTMHISRTISRTWHLLLQNSPTVRHRLYLSTALDKDESQVWFEKTAFPPAEPNIWIPQLLLNQRSWGSAWPFETMLTRILYEDLSPSEPRHWTFSLELSRAQYSRLPPSAAWRDFLATSPPFSDFWYTRSFYELGSVRAPFVTHIDYNAKFPKSQQKYRVHCPNGVTLGHLVDALCHLFEMHSAAEFVMVESVRCGPHDAMVDDRPTTKSWMPGMSAERAQEWHRG